MSINKKDMAAGCFFILVALYYGGTAWRSLPIGEALNMGPGYFPIMLSAIMLVLGIAVAARSFVTKPAVPFGTVPWRAVIMFGVAAAVVAAFLEDLGMFPGIFVAALTASFASSQVKPIPALIVSLAIATFCVLVFGYALNLPLPILGTWFQF